VFAGDQLGWLTWLDQEHANLRVALAFLVDHLRDGERAVRLAGALWRFWYIRCHFGEGRQRLEHALGAVASADTCLEALDAFVGLAVITYTQTDYSAAEAAALRGAELARTTGALGSLAHCLNILAGVSRNRNAYTRALALGEEAAALARQLGDRWMLALSLHNLADVVRLQGDFERARALATQSLRLADELHDRWGVLQAQLVLGWTAHDRGDLVSATELFEQSLETARALGTARDTARALAGRGKLALLRGDLERAAEALEESVALWRPLGDAIRLAQVLVILGRLAAVRGTPSTSEPLLREALRLYAGAHALLGVAETLEALAIDTRPEAATTVRLIASAAAIRERIGSPVEPVELAELEEPLAWARSCLGDAAFESAWQRGRAVLADTFPSDLLDLMETRPRTSSTS